MTHPIRHALPEDLPILANIWHDGWHEAHAAYVPEALTTLRTTADFARRLALFGDDLRVAGPDGTPLGLCAIKGTELYQLYVSQAGRGSGIAAALVADAEMRLAATGVTEAALDCGLENHGAARFYARQGWRDTGVVEVMLETSDGPFPLEIRRFSKVLRTV